MNTQEINELLMAALGPKIFKGVCSASRLPVMDHNTEYPFCFVANTDDGQKNGIHWVAMFFDREGM